MKSALKVNQISHRPYERGWARDDFAKFSDYYLPFWMSKGGFCHFRFLLFLAKLIIGKFWKKSGLFFPIEYTFVNFCRLLMHNLKNIQEYEKIFFATLFRLANNHNQPFFHNPCKNFDFLQQKNFFIKVKFFFSLVHYYYKMCFNSKMSEECVFWPFFF